MSRHLLVRHPDTPCAAIERIEVELDDDARGAMRLVFRLIGDAQRIVAAAPAERPARRDQLWRHTCCELFVREPDGEGYREYNFAPSGDWAAYRFDGYRSNRTPLDAAPPRIELARAADALTLTATLTDLPLPALSPAERLGFACVVETATELSYWALAHPPGRPDFHHAVTFAVAPAVANAARRAG